MKRYELFEDRTDEPSIDNAAFAAMLANVAAEFQAKRSRRRGGRRRRSADDLSDAAYVVPPADELLRSLS